MEEKILNKIVFHYSDGTFKYIEENELDRWLGMNRQVAIFCNMQNANPRWEDIKWKEGDSNPVISEEKENIVSDEEVKVISAID